MEKASSAPLYLVITLLALYLLAPSSNAVPLPRLQRLTLQEAGEMRMPSVEGSSPGPKMEMERTVPEDDMISARMALETQDYAPPGPNNHHKPPGWS